MTDIVERLRSRECNGISCNAQRLEAADEIERLRAENANLTWMLEQDRAELARVATDNAKLREALEWFADPDNYLDYNVEVDGLSVARAALAQKDEGE